MGTGSGTRVPIPDNKPFVTTLKANLKETFFPDDPFRRLKKQPLQRKLLLGLQYFVPIFEWAPRYTFKLFRADLIAGVTIASLAIPQGISYANLATLPPLIGLCKLFPTLDTSFSTCLAYTFYILHRKSNI